MYYRHGTIHELVHVLLPPQITTCLEWKRKGRSALPVYISHPPREKLTVHSLPNHVIALPSRGTTPMGIRRYIGLYTHAEYKRKQRRQHKRAIESHSPIGPTPYHLNKGRTSQPGDNVYRVRIYTAIRIYHTNTRKGNIV